MFRAKSSAHRAKRRWGQIQSILVSASLDELISCVADVLPRAEPSAHRAKPRWGVVYSGLSSRLRSTSKRPKCIEQNRLGFVRRAIAPSVLNRVVSASLDEQTPHRGDIRRRRRIPPRPLGTFVRGEYTVAPEGRHHNKSK